jgi:ABC-type branched-subunit amino acid transport system substrate-binding protein
MDNLMRRSLVSVMLTAVAITANHLYPLGPRALVLGAVLTVTPAALWWRLRATNSRAAALGYLLMNLWIVAGFGVMKGLWGITLPLFLGTLLASLSTAFPAPTVGPYGYEASGILMSVGSLFVGYYAMRLLSARHPSLAHSRRTSVSGAAVAAAAVIGAFVAVHRDRWTPPTSGVVRIGVVVPTSGAYAILGNSFLRAVEMARADLKGTKYRYDLVPVDVGSDPARAGEAIGRAIRERKVDAIVGGISLFGQATKPLATAARIPHLCVCTVRTIGDGAYNFTNIPWPEAEATRWVDEAERRGIKSVALLTQDYPSIQGHVRALKAEAARRNFPIVSEQTFTASATDFRAMIARGGAERPGVYYVEALEPSLDVLAEQLADAGVRNLSSVVAPSLSRRPELFEGVWYTDSDLRDIGFKRRFEEAYPGTQFATHMMPYAYDDFNLVVRAFERGENPAVYLRNLTRYDGTAGPVTRERGSGNFQSTPAVWVIADGRPALVR